MFIHPKWDSENHRLGMKACSPLAYAVRYISDLVGLFGLILVFVIPGFLTLRYLRDQFETRDLWLLLVPLVVGVVGRVMFEFGRALAARKKFEYDYQTMTAKWIEDGQKRVFPNVR